MLSERIKCGVFLGGKTAPRRRWGDPRRFIELLSAAIGGGTVVVLVLICLIALLILILPRILNL